MSSRLRRAAIGGTTVVLVASAIVGISAGSASAHHPILSGSAVCDKTTGQLNIELQAVSDAPSRGKFWQLNSASPSLNWQLGKANRRNESNSFTAVLPNVTVAKAYDFTVSASWFTSVTTDTVNVGPISGTATVTVTKAMLDACKPNVVKDASASLTTTPATCDAPEALVYGAIANATWSGTPDGTQGPGSYHVVATGDPGPPPHVFGDGSSTKVFDGTLSDKLDPNDHPECRSLQPPDVTRHQTARGCDLSAYGDGFVPGAIGRTGKEAYVWSPELRDWVLSGVVNWDPWFQITVWNQAQQVRHGCVAPPVVKPRGNVSCGCDGDPRGHLNNRQSTVSASVVAKVVAPSGKLLYRHVYNVAAGVERDISFGGHHKYPPGSRVVLRLKGGKVLDSETVLPRCPGPPDSGTKQAPEAFPAVPKV